MASVEPDDLDGLAQSAHALFVELDRTRRCAGIVSPLDDEHKDRWSRFGVAYIQTLLTTQGRQLVIVNEAENGQEDLMQDFLTINTSFCAQLYGRRQASRQKTQLLAALEVN